jgi:hypothetical protein
MLFGDVSQPYNWRTKPIIFHQSRSSAMMKQSFYQHDSVGIIAILLTVTSRVPEPSINLGIYAKHSSHWSAHEPRGNGFLLE